MGIGCNSDATKRRRSPTLANGEESPPAAPTRAPPTPTRMNATDDFDADSTYDERSDDHIPAPRHCRQTEDETTRRRERTLVGGSRAELEPALRLDAFIAERGLRRRMRPGLAPPGGADSYRMYAIHRLSSSIIARYLSSTSVVEGFNWRPSIYVTVYAPWLKRNADTGTGYVYTYVQRFCDRWAGMSCIPRYGFCCWASVRARGQTLWRSPSSWSRPRRVM